MLHLTGNVRQWLLSGVGSRPARRHRELEFAARGPIPGRQLLGELESSVDEAIDVLKRLTPESLLAKRHILNREVSVLHAVLHVVEHFSNHTGQIIYLTKMLCNLDLFLNRLQSPQARTNLQAGLPNNNSVREGS
jgi:uncharacterized damage-inducible protein DinB